jgi:fido (protein-threonine AMPylation protein)
MKQYHAMLFEKIDYVETPEGKVRVEGGRYKTENNHVIRLDGQIHQFTEPLQVIGEMERLIDRYNVERANRHPIELAGIMHHRLASIHPFTDGNGRVSRLVMNTILLQAGYTPAIIPVEEKRRYLEALQSADDGQITPFLEVIEQQVAKTLRLMVEVIEGRDAFDFDDLSKMFRGIVEKTKAIEQSLGSANKPPEVRSHEAGTKIRELVKGTIVEHIRRISTPDCPVTYVEVGAIPPALAQVRQEIQGRGLLQTALGLQITSTKRTIPSLQVFLAVSSARNQIAIVGGSSLEKFGGTANQWQQLAGDKLIGSIFFEDWDTEVIRNFVLKICKTAYKAWGDEVERRNELISQEEAELNRLRSRPDQDQI